MEQPRTMSTSGSKPEIETPEGATEAPLVQELRQKLQMVAEELESVRGDLSVQLQQMKETYENSKDECEEQKKRAQNLECELKRRP